MKQLKVESGKLTVEGKRLIDANKIPYHQSGFPKGDGFDSDLDWAFREDIEKLPTVDAEEQAAIRRMLAEGSE